LIRMNGFSVVLRVGVGSLIFEVDEQFMIGYFFIVLFIILPSDFEL